MTLTFDPLTSKSILKRSQVIDRERCGRTDGRTDGHTNGRTPARLGHKLVHPLFSN